MSDILTEIGPETIERLRRLGLIKEGRLQAIRIREDFERRRKLLGSVKAITQLSEEYHMAFETVRNICYAKESNAQP